LRVRLLTLPLMLLLPLLGALLGDAQGFSTGLAVATWLAAAVWWAAFVTTLRDHPDREEAESEAGGVPEELAGPLLPRLD